MEPIFFDAIRCALLITSIDEDDEDDKDDDDAVVVIAVGGSDTTDDNIPRSTVVVVAAIINEYKLLFSTSLDNPAKTMIGLDLKISYIPVCQYLPAYKAIVIGS
jgi:hypothetical protein